MTKGIKLLKYNLFSIFEAENLAKNKQKNRRSCRPELVSGSYQNVVNTPNWQDAETSSA